MGFWWLINGGDPNHLQVLGWFFKHPMPKLSASWLLAFFATTLAPLMESDKKIMGTAGVIWQVKWVHPGRLTWNLQITHLESKMIFQTPMIMFHVNLPGCRLQWAAGELENSWISYTLTETKPPSFMLKINGWIVTFPSGMGYLRDFF